MMEGGDTGALSGKVSSIREKESPSEEETAGLQRYEQGEEVMSNSYHQ